MAATGSSRPLATLIASAVLLGILALAVTPATASQVNFFRGQHCTGDFLLSCRDFQCCNTPAGAVSYEFHYIPGFIAYTYPTTGCSSTSNGNFTAEVPCTDYVSFQSALLPGAMLKMPTE